ncbi:hypothetical protein DFH27DRAFT_580439 [Peziza echinospora]|nr:hypothetical protein DFH27DRAFT_580439 [Peziza echinospora]
MKLLSPPLLVVHPIIWLHHISAVSMARRTYRLTLRRVPVNSGPHILKWGVCSNSNPHSNWRCRRTHVQARTHSSELKIRVNVPKKIYDCLLFEYM